jgi:hypothetical protein
VEWENLCLEASNQYCQRLAERSRERFNQWNDVVDMVKPVAVEIVHRKIHSVVREHDLPKVFQDTVEWDIVGVLMEAE